MSNDFPSSFFDDPLFQSPSLDDSLTKQIVVFDQRVDHAPRAAVLHGAGEDAVDFDNDVDASLSTVTHFTIDPRLIFPLPPPSSYQSFAYHSADEEDGSSASSLWNDSEATSPPTSPEACQDPPKEDEEEIERLPQLYLGAEHLLQLVEYIGNTFDPAEGAVSLPVACDNGAHPPSLVQCSSTAPTYASPAPVSGESREHAPLLHSGAAVASAYGPGNGMQVYITDGFATRTPTGAARISPPPVGNDIQIGADALAPTSRPVLRKPVKRTAVLRKQSTVKRFFCDYPGCGYGTPRSNNLKTHKNEKHLRLRPNRCPFNDCPKSRDGYCRIGDLRDHLAKKHGGLAPPLQTGGPSAPALDASNIAAV
ncbi:hypothetical protein BN946_scf184999.g24 [Trametes cinnabarina]|uniref:C2H2-type domain-containing protein n=1 Tax=Pycnoporus cinnabarinus TaxID=5643 RepID=A0A060SDP3_PYCCI|nr:hypothetical protein BN946_scf184999.g24 [Trametes cinnabarina]